jgi:serine/threonine protein kinase
MLSALDPSLNIPPIMEVAQEHHEDSCLEASRNYRACKKRFGIPQEYDVMVQTLQKVGRGSFSEVYALPNGRVCKIINARKDLPDTNSKNIQDKVAEEVYYLNEITKLKSTLFPHFVVFSERPHCVVGCAQLLQQAIPSTFESLIIMTRAEGATVKECINNNDLLRTKQSIQLFTKQLFEAEKLLNTAFRITYGDPSLTNINWDSKTQKLTVIDLGSVTLLENPVGFLREICSPASCPPETIIQPKGQMVTGGVFGLATVAFAITTGEPLIAASEIKINEERTAIMVDSYYKSRLPYTPKIRQPAVKRIKPSVVQPRVVVSWYTVMYSRLQKEEQFANQEIVETMSFFNKLLNYDPQDRYDCATTVLASPFFYEDARAVEAP